MIRALLVVLGLAVGAFVGTLAGAFLGSDDAMAELTVQLDITQEAGA